MRPIKVTYNSTINSTAYVVECRYHNVENKSLIVVGKLAEDPIPTNYTELVDAAITNKLSPSSILDKQYHNEIVVNERGSKGAKKIEVYSWRL